MPRWPKQKDRPGVDRYGRSEAWHAAADGDTSRLSTAHAKGADINAGDDAGYTPLHVAVQNGHVAVITLLLDLGANPNATDKHGNSPLWTAIMSAPKEDREPIARLLIKAGSDPDHQNEHGRSPRAMAETINNGLEKIFD